MILPFLGICQGLDLTPTIYDGNYCFDSLQTRYILKTHDVANTCDSLIFSYEQTHKSDSVLIANQDSLIAVQDNVILNDSLIINSQAKTIDNQKVIIGNNEAILSHEKGKKWKWGAGGTLLGIILGFIGLQTL